MTIRKTTASSLFAAIAGRILNTGLVIEGADRLPEAAGHRFIPHAAQADHSVQALPRHHHPMRAPASRSADPL